MVKKLFGLINKTINAVLTAVIVLLLPVAMYLSLTGKVISCYQVEGDWLEQISNCSIKDPQ